MKSLKGILPLIALAFLVLAPVATSAYEPRTDEQLADWWEGLTREERREQLRWIDQVDNADPVVSGPLHIIVQTDDGLITSYFDGPLVVDVAGRLHYEISLPAADAEAYTGVPWWRVAGVATMIALPVGFLAGLLISR